jgi:hypothetical protein
VLEEDYFDLGEMERRKQWAHRMKYFIWLLVPVLIVLVTTTISEGVDWLVVLATVLVAYGAISSYWLGVRWERRWDELIREKSGTASVE